MWPAAEWKARVDLAALYRLCDSQGLNEGINNHITAEVPDMPGHFLVFAFGLHWSEVTASNLLLVDSEVPILETFCRISLYSLAACAPTRGQHLRLSLWLVPVIVLLLWIVNCTCPTDFVLSNCRIQHVKACMSFCRHHHAAGYLCTLYFLQCILVQFPVNFTVLSERHGGSCISCHLKRS